MFSARSHNKLMIAVLNFFRCEPNITRFSVRALLPCKLLFILNLCLMGSCVSHAQRLRQPILFQKSRHHNSLTPRVQVTEVREAPHLSSLRYKNPQLIAKDSPVLSAPLDAQKTKHAQQQLPRYQSQTHIVVKQARLKKQESIARLNSSIENALPEIQSTIKQEHQPKQSRDSCLEGGLMLGPVLRKNTSDPKKLALKKRQARKFKAVRHQDYCIGDQVPTWFTPPVPLDEHKRRPDKQQAQGQQQDGGLDAEEQENTRKKSIFHELEEQVREEEYDMSKYSVQRMTVNGVFTYKPE